MDNDFDDVEECRRELVRVVHYLQSDFASPGHARQTCNCTLCYVARTIAQLTHDLSEWQHSSEAERRILAELIDDRAATTDEPRGCACPGQCAAIADLAAERAAHENVVLLVQKEQRISAELRRTIWEQSKSLREAVDAERAAKEKLREGILETLRRLGILNHDTDPSGPELLMAVEDAITAERAAKETAERRATIYERNWDDASKLLDAAIRERDEARRELAMMSDLADALRKERDDGRETISRMSVEFAKVTTKLAAERDEARELKGANNLRAALSAKKLQRYGSHLEEELVAARERLAQVEADAAALAATLNEIMGNCGCCEDTGPCANCERAEDAVEAYNKRVRARAVTS